MTATSHWDDFKIPWNHFCHSQSRKHIHTIPTLLFFPGHFFPSIYNLSPFWIVPHKDTITPGSPSSLFYLNPKRCKRCTQMKNPWGLTQLCFPWTYIFRTCRKVFFPLADGTAQIWNLRQPGSYFAIQNYSNFSQLTAAQHRAGDPGGWNEPLNTRNNTTSVVSSHFKRWQSDNLEFEEIHEERLSLKT